MRSKITSHLSHGFGDHVVGHAGKNIAQDGAPKRVSEIQVHGGMTKQAKTGDTSLGGDHASAIDSLTGTAVVPGRITATPGFGNSGIQSGNPLVKAPGSKKLAPVEVSFGMQSRSHSNELGAAILAEAFRAGDSATRAAHGRLPDGTKENS